MKVQTHKTSDKSPTSRLETLFFIYIYMQYTTLVGKPDGKRPLGRTRCRYVDNIKIDLRETGWDGMDWIDLVQERNQWRGLLSTAMNLCVP
jgi:hypothetical protein